MSLNSKMGAKIRQARQQAGLTQKDLGQQLGKSGATIAYLEQGKRRISPDVLEQIATATGKPLSYFYEEAEASSSKLEGQLDKLTEQLSHLKTLLNHSALEKSGDFNMSLFDQASDLMVVIDLKGKVIAMNKGYEDFFGWSKSEVIGQPFWKFKLIKARHMPALIKLFHNVVKKNEPVRFMRLTMMNKAGDDIEVECTTEMLYEDGKPWAMFSIVRPVNLPMVQFEDVAEDQ